MITAAQIQRIYGMGATLGILDSGNKDDMLHSLVNSITGKDSIKQLTNDDYKAVVRELAVRIKTSQLSAPPSKPHRTVKHYESGQGKMTEGQQRKVWYLMYQLKACDNQINTASLGDRLCGIVKRQFEVDVTAKAPLKWLSYEQGNQLIEIIKNYCKSAERKVMRGG